MALALIIFGFILGVAFVFLAAAFAVASNESRKEEQEDRGDIA